MRKRWKNFLRSFSSQLHVKSVGASLVKTGSAGLSLGGLHKPLLTTAVADVLRPMLDHVVINPSPTGQDESRAIAANLPFAGLVNSLKLGFG